MTGDDEKSRPLNARPALLSKRPGLVALLLRMAGILFVAEFAVMCLLPLTGIPEGIWRNVADCLMLAALALPSLYLLIGDRSWLAIGQQNVQRLSGPEKRMRLVMLTQVAMVIGIVGVYSLGETEKDSGTHVINMAGRQRMLSQRLISIAMFDMMESTGTEEGEAHTMQVRETRELTAQFERVLAGLIAGDAELGLPRCSSQEAVRQLEATREAFKSLAVLVEQCDESFTMHEAHIHHAALFEAGTRVLEEMELAVKLLQNHYEGRARRLQTMLGISSVGAMLIAVLLLVVFVQMIAHRRRNEEMLQRFRAALDTSADSIFLIDRATMRFVDVNDTACASVGYSRKELLTMGPQDIKPLYTREQLATHFDAVIRREDGADSLATVHRRKDGSDFPVEALLRCLSDGAQHVIVAAVRDLTQRKRAEQELEDLHNQLLEASRQSGIAEIASGVLHNVGNVLNSVNVSATVVSEKVRQFKVAGLSKATRLMREHEHDLGAFISGDEQGKQLPHYLSKLAEHLTDEQAAVLDELGTLTKDVDHIKSIINTQQSHATAANVTEPVSIADVVDDALRINAASFERYEIELVRAYEEMPMVEVNKQQLLQILVNLVKNAEQALLDGSPDRSRRLTVRAGVSGQDRVRIEVIDTGVGIAQDNLARIFTHGFTTKKEGHGFGLHSAVRAVKEMGGSLTVHSDGLDKGATFTLELLLQPTEIMH